MESKAIAKYVGVSVRKARIPADIVRGMKAVEAMDVLKYMPKGAAIHVRKVVASAVANAVNVNGMSENTLFIHEVKVDHGPTQRRIYYKGKGGYRFFIRPTSHITVVLRDNAAAKKSEIKNSKSEKKKIEAGSLKPEVKEVKQEVEAKVEKKAVKKSVAKSVKKPVAKATKKVK